jgi:pleckstrin homology domain-containing family G member 1/2/3
MSEDQPPLSPLEIKQYNSKTLPKRIEKIKQKRAKKETAKFYTLLDDEAPDDTILKIVEASDDNKPEPSEPFDDSQADTSGLNFSKKKDAEIIRSILEKSEFKKVQKPGALRRKSLEQMDKSPLTSRKISEVLAEKATRKESTSSIDTPVIEPLYEELLRNVHVPYKFAPAIVKRSLSVSSSSSTKETIEPTPAHAESTTTLNDDDNDGSECDYVTLTYSNEGLETIDGEYVGKNSPPRLNEISNSDTNICYNQRNSLSQLNSSDDLKVTDSIGDLDRRSSITSRSRSFLHKFITLRSVDDDLTSQKSVAASISASSRKSLDGGFIFNLKNTPPVYRQGSEDMGNRIAHVDYADPKTLFPSAVNIFVNKNSLNQRDSVVSSSSDSVSDLNKTSKQTQPDVEPFSDSFYEDHAESLLENDFRDSAIYSDDSNERRLESNSQSEEHIYATVTKQPTPAKPTPPKIPKKPTLTLKSNIATRIPTSLQSPPPVPFKPSNLKSPEVRNAIFTMRKLNQPADEKSLLPRLPQKSWVSQQVQKFQ